MNIVVKSHQPSDGFDVSGREPFKSGAGKGDRNRSKTKAFKEGYEEINWGPQHTKRRIS